MSRQLINRSPDLKALMDDGYELAIKGDHLVIHNVPYVNGEKQVKRGVLVSVLDMAGDVTTTPSTHVTMFAGGHPCDINGQELKKIKHGTSRQTICEGLVVEHSFSSKPAGGYRDFHEKMTTYIAIISGPAEAIDPNTTARTCAVTESGDQDCVFNYIDTASSRAGISAVSKKLGQLKIGIIGLGGTGSYILDLVAKTHVKEIHLFDRGVFGQHNAFRCPGAPSIEELKQRPKKVHYLAKRYAPMRKNIVAHDCHIDASNVDLLQKFDFVFLSVDKGNIKQPIIEKLEKFDIPFIDVGMGIYFADDQLFGVMRVTTSTINKRDHVREKKRISFTGGDVDDEYSKNIQIADLNALNAALAVIKWKKIFRIYGDFDQEHFCAYTLDGNHLVNEDKS